MRPDTAVILSAGLGTRMRPLTLKTPKPLLLLEGQPILAHTLKHLRKAGVTNILVNAHHLAGQIADFLKSYPEARLSIEDELLETGGAITAMRTKNLLPELPFYIINGDAFWIDGPTDTLNRLATAFDPEKMDAMLLLARTAGTIAETGSGDFLWPRGGKPKRREERDVAPYLFAGVQIVSPALFADAPPPPFSMNLLWDRAMAADRLDAIVHDGLWFHLSTPDDLARADAMLDAREVGNTT
jgi:MurNAc alpha-1-phosphate uridylyltransferase